ncbi:hypothetical protein, partial [Escherichia coli]|uniref:hypothetical protein n=1 Tax=Escherichia coli TaxID=562 RepID=UPI0028DDAF25
NLACGDGDASRDLVNPASSDLSGLDEGAGGANAQNIQVPTISRPAGTNQVPDAISYRYRFHSMSMTEEQRSLSPLATFSASLKKVP